MKCVFSEFCLGHFFMRNKNSLQSSLLILKIDGFITDKVNNREVCDYLKGDLV